MGRTDTELKLSETEILIFKHEKHEKFDLDSLSAKLTKLKKIRTSQVANRVVSDIVLERRTRGHYDVFMSVLSIFLLHKVDPVYGCTIRH